MKQFIYPYVLFKDSQKAVDYYISVFGGEVVYSMYGKDTPNCPKEQLNTIYHLQYKLHNSQLYFADAHKKDQGRIMLHLDFEDKIEMNKAFKNMAIEGNVIKALEETHWGAVFGVIKDKFQVTWQFHYTLPHEQ